MAGNITQRGIPGRGMSLPARRVQQVRAQGGQGLQRHNLYTLAKEEAKAKHLLFQHVLYGKIRLMHCIPE